MQRKLNRASGGRVAGLAAFRLLLGLLLVAVAAVAAGALWLRNAVYQPVSHSAAARVITISPGMGTKAIIGRLTDAGVVKRPSALILYLALMGESDELQAGDYTFDSPISAIEAINKIRRGDISFERVTIPEGFNRFEIAQTLAEKTGKGTGDDFLRLMNDTRSVARIAGSARNLEGYLFPDTYLFTAQTTIEELIKAMVERFDRIFSPEWATRASQLGLSIHEVVTLASIIEEEARVDEDRPLIASVLMNRLKLGMPLAADPTFIYAAILANDYDGNPNQPRHRRRASRYNTYIYTGLPPGPICSPGKEAMQAALYPADTDFLYFVVSGLDGRHKFSRTAAEHDIAVEEYRKQRQLQRDSGSSR